MEKEDRTERRCWGIIRNVKRCHRTGQWRFFCEDHTNQPIYWLFVLIFTVVAGTASIYSVFIKPTKIPMSSAEKKNNRPYLLASSNWIGYSPFWLADRLGYLDRTIWKLDHELISTSESYRDALRNQRVDAFAGSIDNCINDIAREAKDPQFNPTIALFLGRSVGGDAVVAREPLADIADLRGRFVGVWSGSTAHFLLNYALRKSGIDIDTVNIEHEGNPRHLVERFERGDFAAIAVWSPWSQYAVRAGGRRLVDSSDVRLAPIILDVLYFVHPQILYDDDKAVANLLGAWDAGVLAIRSGEYRADLAAWLGLTVEELVLTLEGIKLYTVEESLHTLLRWEILAKTVAEQCRFAGLCRGGSSPCGHVDDGPARIYVAYGGGSR